MEHKIALISLETFMLEFLPGPDLPRDVSMDALGNSVGSQHQKPGPMHDKLRDVANHIFSQVPAGAGSWKLVATDTPTRRGLDCTERMAPKEHTGPTVTVYSVEDDSPSSADAINSSVTNGQEERKRKRQKHQGREAGIAPLWVCLLIESRTDVDDSPLMVPRAIEVTGPRPEATSGTPGPEMSRLVAPTAPASSTPTAPPTSQTSVSSTASSIVSIPAAAELDQDAAPSLLRLGTTGGAQTMEQMAHDISEILRQQFLLHFFTIFICLDHIWLLRWDRAGLVVSEPFNFAEEPQHLYTFFYRFACMDDVQRGRDPTVVPASEAEVKVMRSIDQFDSAWHKTQYTATMTAGWPIYKVLIPEEDVISTAELSEGRKDRADSELSEGRERGFLVGKPYFMSDSPTGRGTRGYIAYDVAEHRLVFLKEYWRLDAPTYHPEGEVYLRLHSKQVPYIATPVAAGDVLDATGGMHHTRAQDFFPDPPPKLIQYRIILEEIGKPLEEYETSFELMSAMYCCIYAHMKAWTEGEVLHRDISRANLLMYPYRNDDGEIEWLGLIVDWGLCKYKDELGLPQVQNTRSGTWQFISAVLLAHPGVFPHAVWHDLESFIHVLHWLCLRFHKTNYTESDDNRESLLKRVDAVYDHSNKTRNGISVGGQEKLALMQDGTLPFKLVAGSTGQSGPGLYRLLTDLSALCKEHYKWLKPQLPTATPEEEKEEGQGQPQRSRSRLLPPRRNVVSAVGPTISEAPAQPVLENHTKILDVFETMSQGKWIPDKKIEDQFAHSNTTMDQQVKLKRSSEESISLDERPGKRIRSPTGSASVSIAPQLGSISENLKG